MPVPHRESDSAGALRGASRTVLFATVFIDLLGFGIVIPFLPLYAERLGIGATAIGLILSIYSLMQLVAAPILGGISDRIGRRPIIMLGLLGSSASYVIYGFAGSLPLLLLSRAVHGACAGTVSTAQAYVADTTTAEQRAHGMGMIGAAFGLGFVLGPAVGGLLGQWGLRVPVYFAAALTFANLLFAAAKLPESRRGTGVGRARIGELIGPLLMLPAQLTRDRRARLFLLAFLATAGMALFETTFAIMAPAVYGYRALGIGALLAYAGLIQAITQGYLLGRLAKRMGELRLVRIGTLLFGLGLTPLASFASQAMLFILLAILSIGYGLANPSIASLISKRTERRLQGEILGVNQSALAIARIIGPIVAGALYTAYGPEAAYLGGGLLAFAALAVAIGGVGPAAGEVQR